MRLEVPMEHPGSVGLLQDSGDGAHESSGFPVVRFGGTTLHVSKVIRILAGLSIDGRYKATCDHGNRCVRSDHKRLLGMAG